MKVKIFGKSIPVLAIVALVMSAGLVSAAVVNYLSNTVTKPVTVESPIKLSGDITYTPLAGTKMAEGVNAILTRDGEFLHMAFDVEEEAESFLLVFMDTKDGGTIYTDPQGDEHGVDYMIVDPFVNDNAFGGWYLGKWLTAEERIDAGAPEDIESGWSEPYEFVITHRPAEVTWRAWDRKGFVTKESIIDGCTHYEFEIPLTDIEFDEAYRLSLFVQTGAGMSDCVTLDIPEAEVTTEPFDDYAFTLTLYGGSEFSMTFKATNLANSEMDVTRGLVMSSDAGEWKSIDELNEIASVGPGTPVEGISGDYRVEAFDLGTIGAGQTVEYAVTIKLSPIAAPATYTIKGVAVWTDALPAELAESVAYIVEAAEITP